MDGALHDYGLTFKEDEEEIDEEFGINISKLRSVYKLYEDCKRADYIGDDSTCFNPMLDALDEIYPKVVKEVRNILKHLSESELESFLAKHDFGRQMVDELKLICPKHV